MGKPIKKNKPYSPGKSYKRAVLGVLIALLIITSIAFLVYWLYQNDPQTRQSIDQSIAYFTNLYKEMGWRGFILFFLVVGGFIVSFIMKK